MSGMYNVVFRKHPNFHALMKVIGLKPGQFHRVRDAFPTAEGTVTVYTRGGGRNLACECGGQDHGELVDGTYHAPDCPVALDHALKAHPLLIGAKDCTYDGTYRNYHFRVPERYASAVAGMPVYEPRELAWVAALERMRSDPTEVERMALSMGRHLKAVEITPDGPRDVNIEDLLRSGR